MTKFFKEVQSADNSFLLELRMEMNWNVKKFYRLVTLFHEYIQFQGGKTELNRDVVAGIDLIKVLISDFERRTDDKNPLANYYRQCVEIFEVLTFHYFHDTKMIANVKDMIEEIKVVKR